MEDVDQDRTALMVAARCGRADIIDALLLEAGSGSDDELLAQCTNRGRTPLMYALKKGHGTCATLLLSSSKSRDTAISQLRSVTHDGITALMYAIKYNTAVSHVLDALSNQGIASEAVLVSDINGYTPLMYACLYGHHESVSSLLGIGARDKQLVARNKHGESAIELAAFEYEHPRRDCLLELLKSDNRAFIDDEVLNRVLRFQCLSLCHTYHDIVTLAGPVPFDRYCITRLLTFGARLKFDDLDEPFPTGAFDTCMTVLWKIIQDMACHVASELGDVECIYRAIGSPSPIPYGPDERSLSRSEMPIMTEWPWSLIQRLACKKEEVEAREARAELTAELTRAIVDLILVATSPPA